MMHEREVTGAEGVLRLGRALLAGWASALLACNPGPWETEPDVRLQVEVLRDGQRIPAEQIDLGPGGLRIVHRTDVFRPRTYETRGHEVHRECVPRYTSSGAATEPAHCGDLASGPTGSALTAADLAAGAEAFLAAKGAVLHTLHASPEQAPIVVDVDSAQGTAPLVAETSLDGRERYWARFWADCRGCLGLVWLEVRYQGVSYCTRPGSPAVMDGTFKARVDLGADMRPGSPIEQDLDRAPCGDRSWLQALIRERADLNFRAGM